MEDELQDVGCEEAAEVVEEDSDEFLGEDEDAVMKEMFGSEEDEGKEVARTAFLADIELLGEPMLNVGKGSADEPPAGLEKLQSDEE